MTGSLRLSCLVFLLVAITILLGAQVVQVFRDAALPPPLPYGLTMQDPAQQAEWRPNLPDADVSPSQ